MARSFGSDLVDFGIDRSSRKGQVCQANTDFIIKMSQIKIELKNVNYIYGQNTPFMIKALDDINIGIESSKVTGIIGHTGSGKSTLVRLFNGLERPTSGQVLLDGLDIWENPKKIGDVRFKVGLVMQYPEYQLFEETIRADIGFGPRNMGLSKEEIDARVEEAAELVGLDKELLDRSPFDLSGGEKRRAAIAGVIAMRPDVLVLDEPAAGLDPRGRNVIFECIKHYKAHTSATVIIVSHSMEDMAAVCDNLIVMSKSRIFLSGSCDEIFSHSEELPKIGLDVPQITRLTDILAERGVLEGKSIYTVDEAEKQILEMFERKNITD